MAPVARVSHTLPGRTRIRIEEKRGDEAYFAALKQALTESSDVLAVETNSLTGSVLMYHKGDGLAVWRYAEEKGLLHVNEKDLHVLPAVSVAANAASNRQNPVQKLKSTVRAIEKFRPLLLMSFLGMGIAQAIEGNIAIPALTAFWYAYALYMLPEATGSTNMESDLPDRKTAQLAPSARDSGGYEKVATLM